MPTTQSLGPMAELLGQHAITSIVRIITFLTDRSPKIFMHHRFLQILGAGFEVGDFVRWHNDVDFGIGFRAAVPGGKGEILN